MLGFGSRWYGQFSLPTAELLVLIIMQALYEYRPTYYGCFSFILLLEGVLVQEELA